MSARSLRGRATLMVCVALPALAVGDCGGGSASGEPDRAFDTSVPRPAYTADGPLVLFDEAHRNIHRIRRTYAPFAEVLRNDGYVVEASGDRFDGGIPAGASVLVVANAIGSNERNDDPAMTDAEADSVVAWVRRGGSLLLVTDHYPTGMAVRNLASRLGVDMSEGVTEDSVRHDTRFDPSHIVFDSFPAHPATRGLTRVLTFTGQSLGVPAGAVALELGSGRVVVLGEAAMISAQLSPHDGSPFGMNVVGYDNRAFLLNVMHWLSKHE